MNIQKQVTYDAKTKLYRIETGPWLPAWDEVNETNISEFGFDIQINTIFFASQYPIISIESTNSTVTYTVSIIGNSGEIVDSTANEFDNQELFIFDVLYFIEDENTCEDIYGNLVNIFTLADDGVLYGSSDSTEPTSVSAECCLAFGYTFDSDDAKCYWSKPCVIDDVIKIVISPEGNDGVLYQVDSGQTCTLDIEFDYLLEYNCDKLMTCSNDSQIVDILSGVTVNMTLERVIPNTISGENINYESPYINDTVYEENLFGNLNFLTLLTNEQTGVFLNGSNCSDVINKIKLELGVNDYLIGNNTLFSKWLHFKVSIVDPSLLGMIQNEKIKLGFKLIGSSCDMSILIDNIEFNRLCTFIDLDETFISKCPSFSIDRIIDNKKSWVGKEELDNREFKLSRRETDYNINHRKLGINSKEVEIEISPARAIETDVMNAILLFPCLIDEIPVPTSINDNVFTIEEFKNILLSELVDVKSRQTISAYPVLRMLYDRYLNSMEACGVQTNAFNYNHMDEFIAMIGNYWVDLIEQVIPSTTIWGSTYRYNNTIFDSNKFVYKKSSLLLCNVSSSIPLEIIGSNPSIQVVKTTISVDSSGTTINEVSSCTGAYIVQIDDGSEFIGTVRILGDSNKSSKTGKGDVIMLNEASYSVNQIN